MDFLIASGIFAVVMALMLVLAASGNKDNEKAYQLLQQVTRAGEDDGANQLMRVDPRQRADSGSEMLHFLYRLNLLKQLEQSMWQAGLYMRVSEMLLVIVMMFGAGLAGGELLLGDPTLALGTGCALSLLPISYLIFRRKRRLRAFSVQLPFALDLIKSSLEAGHSLLRALQVLVQEFSDPIGGEFRTVLEQARLGMPLPLAFEELLRRVPEDDLRLLVVAIKVQSEVGSSLAQIVGRLSEIVRTRQRLQQQIRSMTAQSRMSGMIVALLPAVVLCAFSVVQPSYARMLFHDPAGVTALKIAIGLDFMAFITIRRILRMDY
ncbi:MAG: type II secretion system F family protein [Candidatus Binataceae bacterium]